MNGINVNLYDGQLHVALQYVPPGGSATYGMTFQGNVKGYYDADWVQVLQATSYSRPGYDFTYGDALDSGFPYRPPGVPITPAQAFDTPEVRVLAPPASPSGTYIFSATFAMFYMVKPYGSPDGAIWVPALQLNWGWGVTFTYNNPTQAPLDPSMISISQTPGDAWHSINGQTYTASRTSLRRQPCRRGAELWPPPP